MFVVFVFFVLLLLLLLLLFLCFLFVVFVVVVVLVVVVVAARRGRRRGCPLADAAARAPDAAARWLVSNVNAAVTPRHRLVPAARRSRRGGRAASTAPQAVGELVLWRRVEKGLCDDGLVGQRLLVLGGDEGALQAAPEPALVLGLDERALVVPGHVGVLDVCGVHEVADAGLVINVVGWP